jgi:hypothetical protein
LLSGAGLAKRRRISECEEQTVEEDEPTCGRGLAQSRAVPAGLAAVAARLAQNLEVHTRALDLGDAAAVQERSVYERIARDLRSAAADLKTAAAEMASAVDLPMGAHDLEAITTPDVLEAFESYVAAEDDLRRLLDARSVDNEAMLTAIRAEIDSPEADTAAGGAASA